VDLTVAPGAVTIDAQPVVANGGKSGIIIGYLANGTIATTSAQDLQNKLAAAGPGTSQLALGFAGMAVGFTEIAAPGTYSVCLVPLPVEVQGRGGMGYFDRHAGKLPAFCQTMQVPAAPDTQTVQIPVEIPAYIADPQSGSGTRGGGRIGGATR